MWKPKKSSFQSISNNPADPTQFYYKPGTGYFYWKRFELAVRFLNELPKAERCLELACGTGIFLPELSRHCAALYAIDLGADMGAIRHLLAKEGVAADLRNGDICRMPFEDGFFDLAVGMSCMEHLPDPRAALKEAHRVLKAKGTVILGMPVETPALNLFFKSVGFNHADEHVSEYHDIIRIAREVFPHVETIHFPPFMPLGASLYVVLKCVK